MPANSKPTRKKSARNWRKWASAKARSGSTLRICERCGPRWANRGKKPTRVTFCWRCSKRVPEPSPATTTAEGVDFETPTSRNVRVVLRAKARMAKVNQSSARMERNPCALTCEITGSATILIVAMTTIVLEFELPIWLNKVRRGSSHQPPPTVRNLRRGREQKQHHEARAKEKGKDFQGRS
jgi:hypothetical protein